MNIPGNGNFLIGVAIEFNVMMIGDFDHLFHKLHIKYADKNTTSKNVKTKNIL